MYDVLISPKIVSYKKDLNNIISKISEQIMGNE